MYVSIFLIRKKKEKKHFVITYIFLKKKKKSLCHLRQNKAMKENNPSTSV